MQDSPDNPATLLSSRSIGPFICRLSIKRFRGILDLSWQPSKGVNLILGGGDVGKTSVLDAIGLLLSPTNPSTVLDTDYYGRDVEAGFEIEAVCSLPVATGITYQTKPSWPWMWNGSEAVVPSLDEDDVAGEPVYRLRVRGTENLELAYEIIQPDSSTEVLPVGLRREIGLVRLSGDDRNDRDLRLVQGSALDRLLADRGYRSRLASELAKTDVKEELNEKAKDTLKALDATFRKRKLPENLDLAITSSQGLSITALVGLTANRCASDHNDVQLPLASWGSGTRRIAALAIAEQNQGESPVMLVDEIERGLEPYRQRSLMHQLQDGKSQVFITTHSLSAISAASEAAIWYMDQKGRIGSLESHKIAAHRKNDPETFLARLTIVGEGVTEVGFVTFLLESALSASLQQYGIHISDGGGHETTLNMLEALSDGGLRFDGFADNEEKYPSRWKSVEDELGALLFRWPTGCLEENVISVLQEDKLEALIVDPEDSKTGMRLRTLADRLGIQDKDFQTIKTKAGANLRAIIVEAATGTVPPDKQSERRQYQAHGQTWFKSTAGGRELGMKVFSLGVWPTLKAQLMPFLNAVRRAVELEEIQDLQT
jgi:putative ATP-dependent endonuclease of the OLD family